MKISSLFIVFAFFCSFLSFGSVSLAKGNEKKAEFVESQWNNKKVVFLGDSITDKIHCGTKKNYWQYLEESLGIEALVYGINGHKFTDLLNQAKKLKSELDNKFDAIIIFAGTNDYNAGLELGQWYTFKDEKVALANDKSEIRKRKIFDTTSNTYRACINRLMSYIKDNFPEKQVIILTPIHRGYATFGKGNVQPDESYPNKIGLYIDDYVNVLKEASNIWAVPLVDLNSLSGLYPSKASHSQDFHNKDTDLLHPNAKGHYRMAKTLTYQLIALPANFD